MLRRDELFSVLFDVQRALQSQFSSSVLLIASRGDTIVGSCGILNQVNVVAPLEQRHSEGGTVAHKRYSETSSACLGSLGNQICSSILVHSNPSGLYASQSVLLVSIASQYC